MNIHVARTPPFRTGFTHTCCQGQTGSLTVRPDRARWVLAGLDRLATESNLGAIGLTGTDTLYFRLVIYYDIGPTTASRRH